MPGRGVGGDTRLTITDGRRPMICYEEGCEEKADVAYEHHHDEVVEVTGYCEGHDPHPEQPYDTPFNPKEADTDL